MKWKITQSLRKRMHGTKFDRKQYILRLGYKEKLIVGARGLLKTQIRGKEGKMAYQSCFCALGPIGEKKVEE